MNSLEKYFKKIRNDFPILNQKINEKKLIYVDNSATSQKPKQVIKALTNYYETYNSNVHRGIHTLAEKSTKNYEEVRQIVGNLINSRKENIVFTKGTTDSLNLLSNGIKHLLKKGDEIVLSQMEHHANIVPWQEVAKKTGAKLKFIPINKDFELDIKEAKKLITKKTKIISLTHISNVLGTVNDIKLFAKLAKKNNALFFVDGAQSIQHQKLDIKKLDIDAFVFSSHKLYGPTGIGVLYAKKKVLDILEPKEFGGDMIDEVFFDYSTYAKPPLKFEAGTPNIADVIAFGEAIKYFEKIDIKKIEKYEKDLTAYFLKKFKTLRNYKLQGNFKTKNRAGVFSITHPKIHAHDLTTILDKEAIATRAGHHCAMPLMSVLDVSATTRVSLSFYNTKEEIDKIIEVLRKAEIIYEKGEFLV